MKQAASLDRVAIGHLNPGMISRDWAMETGLAIIETNGRCKMGCLHCNIADENTKSLAENSPDYLRFIEMYASQAPRGSNVILKNGAGSLGAKELALVEKALQRGLFITITTEGLTVPEYFSNRVEELNREYPGQVGYTVSLDGSRDEIHRKLRRNIPFDKVTAFIKDQVQRGVYVETNFVAHSENVGDLKKYVNFCVNELGAERVNVLPLQEIGAAAANHLQPPDLVSLVDSLIEAYESGSERVKQAIGHTIGGYAAKLREGTERSSCEGCPAGSKHMMMIDSRGDVYPCNSLRDGKYKLGNIGTLSLKELHDGDRFRQVRGSIVSSVDGIDSPLNFGCPRIIEKRPEEYRRALEHLNRKLEESGVDISRIQKEGKRVCYARTF